jgi:hypothetical protein
MENIDLDLDALVPETRKVRLNGKVFAIQQPSLFDLLKLAKLGSKIQNVDGTPESQSVLDELIKTFENLIPEIKGEKLTVKQMIGLFNYLSKMVEPVQTVELKKAGITTDITEKKSSSD